MRVESSTRTLQMRLPEQRLCTCSMTSTLQPMKPKSVLTQRPNDMRPYSADVTRITWPEEHSALNQCYFSCGFSVTVAVTVILNQYKFYEHTRNSVPLQVCNGSYHQYVFEIPTYKSTKLHVTSFIVQCQSVTGAHCSHYSLHTSDTVTRSTCGCILEMHLCMQDFSVLKIFLLVNCFLYFSFS